MHITIEPSTYSGDIPVLLKSSYLKPSIDAEKPLPLASGTSCKFAVILFKHTTFNYKVYYDYD